jgi:hypothetical protein
MNEIATLDTSVLPPELMLDPHHPLADEYIKKAQNVQRMIVSTSALLKPKQVIACKLRHTGMQMNDIAAKVGVTPTTISAWMKLAPMLKLTSLLTYYQVALDGPNEAQRRNMLWRIAVTNEEVAPKVSNSALAELNKMTIVDYDRKNTGGGSGPVTIVINNQLSRGSLDE